jgi:hypothetical protein
MSAKSNYLETKVLQHFLKAGSAVSQPANVYVALLTSATVPDFEAGTNGTEVTGGAYARQVVTFTESNGTASNSVDMLFPVATANWGTIRYFEIRDALSGGNLLYGGQFAADKVINTDDQLKIAATQLQVTEA